MTLTEQLQFDRWRREVRAGQARALRTSHASGTTRMRTGQLPGMSMGMGGATDFNLNIPPQPAVFQAASGPSPIQLMLGGLALVAAGIIFTRNSR